VDIPDIKALLYHLALVLQATLLPGLLCTTVWEWYSIDLLAVQSPFNEKNIM